MTDASEGVLWGDPGRVDIQDEVLAERSKWIGAPDGFNGQYWCFG